LRRLSIIALLSVTLLGAGCASQPKTPPPPPPDTISATALDALCARLQMDAFATGSPLALVNTTRPLATQTSVSSLMLIAERNAHTNPQRLGMTMVQGNRALPVSIDGSSCAWKSITLAQAASLRDEVIVELSAPAPSPFSARDAGIFARVSVGGEGSSASWYWIALAAYGDRWAVRGVSVLVQ
jgi:hypothetical protein